MTVTSTLYVGIDVSLDTNQACAMNFDQVVFFNQSFKNSLDSAELLINRISNVLHKENLTHVVVVMESTSLYFFHVANLISVDEELKQFNCKVYCVNPKTTTNYKKSYNEMSKNDPSDAWLLSDFARIGRCKNLSEWRGASYVALQRLTRYRFHLAQNLSKEKNYALNNIYLKFSQLRKKQGSKDNTNPFSNLFGATSSAVLTDFVTTDEIINMPLEELIEYLEIKSKGRFNDSKEVAKLLKKCANDSYRLDKLSYDALNITIASNLRMISMLEKELKNLDKQILDFVKGIDSHAVTSLRSLPGVGPVYAAGIIAEIGSIDFFKNDSALAKYAGVAWKDNSSGKFMSEDNHLIDSGNMFLKYYLEEACNLMRQKDSVFNAYYSRKFNEAQTHKHKRALVLTTRKFIRLIYRLLHDNKLYVNPETGEVKTVTE